MNQPAHRCGLVALVGAPNVGKSTLLNTLLGQKVSIVSPKPQTTRILARGILSRLGWQAVLIDTPGIMQQPANLLEKGMRNSSLDVLKDADVVLYIASSDIELAKQVPQGFQPNPLRTILVLNKSDLSQGQERQELGKKLQEVLGTQEVLEISARKKSGLQALEETLAKHLPEGPALYGEDEITDLTLRQSAAEIIREKALLFTKDEVPHSLAVELEDYREESSGLHRITATLFVERDSQKGILIGKKGSMLKKIGSAARVELEELTQAKVFLTLWIKVAKGWKKDEIFLKRMQYFEGRQ